jgi:cytochrome P450
VLQFDDADRLRVDRPASAHLGFGHGAHHCIGASLARMELQEALRVLLTRLPDLQLAVEAEWDIRNVNPRSKNYAGEMVNPNPAVGGHEAGHTHDAALR